MTDRPYSFWKAFWIRYRSHPLGLISLAVVILFCLVGVYAPFLASSKPLMVAYGGKLYFPLFRTLFFEGFYTKRLDIFFNLFIFILPLFVISVLTLKRWKMAWLFLTLIQFGSFFYLILYPLDDPASDSELNIERQNLIVEQLKKNNDPNEMPKPLPNTSWAFELKYMSPYAKLNLLTREVLLKEQNDKLAKYSDLYEKTVMRRFNLKEKSSNTALPTLYNQERNLRESQLKTGRSYLQEQQAEFLKETVNPKDRHFLLAYENIESNMNYIEEKRRWIEDESKKLRWMIMPPLSSFHWQDDAGGNLTLNQLISFYDVTRINRKDLVASLIFGVRISIVVGIVSISLAMLIGIPIGAFSGFYGGTFDIITLRLVEIWESMPTFFMLLLVVAIVQNKSIFIVISVIGIFGWTSFCRYMRGEFFKQRSLPYVESCKALGAKDRVTMFAQILPNAIPPILTLMPFAIMGAITSEAGLSFLGLGEEGSCSWGVLMDEGRRAFPGESYLLWPPAILLTILLVAIALVGDALRDSLDPKLQTSD